MKRNNKKIIRMFVVLLVLLIALLIVVMVKKNAGETDEIYQNEYQEQLLDEISEDEYFPDMEDGSEEIQEESVDKESAEPEKL